MLKNREQILTAIQTAEGVPATPIASDAVLIYEPEDTEDEQSFLTQRPAGASLSRDVEPPGVSIRQNRFRQHWRGSGAVGTAPDWGKHVRACAMRQTGLVRLDLTGMSATEQIVVGEVVYQGASLAAATAIGICVTHLRGADGAILVAPISGTFASGAVVGAGCAASATSAAPVTATQGFAYLLDSLRVVQLTVASWSSAPAIATVGAVYDVLRGGFAVGGLQIIDAGAGPNWATTVLAVQLWGELANADTVTDGSNSGTLNAAPTQVRSPSLSIARNSDGYLQRTADARGTFTLGGEAGQPLQFQFDFRGSPLSHSAALPVATGFLGGVSAPRLFGSWVGLRRGSQFFRFPTKRLELAVNNTVAISNDANAAGGARAAIITDRDPTITLEIEQAGMAFDVKSLQQNATLIGLGAVLGGNGTGTYAGRTAGNTLVMAAPSCQVTEMAPGESEGIKTWVLTLKPKRLLEAGDDELVLAAF